MSALDNYHEKITLLSESLRGNDNSIALNKNTSNLFRHRQETTANKLDVSEFTNLIDIDVINLTADIEGMITYEEFVKGTMKYGLLPAVVPELKTITVGGAYIGGGIESSSFRYGLVHETVTEVDILLSDGRIITANKDNEYKDLYYALPNSYGTYGYVLRLRVKLIHTKPFVKLQHIKFSDSKKLLAKIENVSNEKNNISYCDAVVFSEKEMVLTLGEFVEQAPYSSNYKHMNIYYRSLPLRNEDYLTTEDYIWRWDTDWFWCSKHLYMQNHVSRLLLGKWFLNSKSYWKIRHYASSLPWLAKILSWIQKPAESVIQDVQIPISRSNDFLQFFNEKIKITPVWLCPTMPQKSEHKFSLCPLTDELHINFGFWDTVPSQKEEGFYNILIEEKVEELKGNKSLYSNSFYTEEKFWQLYNKPIYDELKKQYDPSARFKNLYQKCVLDKQIQGSSLVIRNEDCMGTYPCNPKCELRDLTPEF